MTPAHRYPPEKGIVEFGVRACATCLLRQQGKHAEAGGKAPLKHAQTKLNPLKAAATLDTFTPDKLAKVPHRAGSHALQLGRRIVIAIVKCKPHAGQPCPRGEFGHRATWYIVARSH